MLALIGLGLGDEKNLTLHAVETLKTCSKVYLESYTSPFGGKITALETVIGKKIVLAKRALIENEANSILKEAKKENVAILIVGDIFSATTHADLLQRARQQEVEVQLLHNASIISAVGITGLQVYKFGMTTSMVFFTEKWKPMTPYDVIQKNLECGYHTLLLLDLKEEKHGFNCMTVNTCLKQLRELEETKKARIITNNTKVVGCARLGRPDYHVRFDRAKDLMTHDFGEPPHCVIVPGKLHFMEEEVLEWYSLKRGKKR